MNCPRHGVPITKAQCPQCCYHKGQLYFDDNEPGLRCPDCGRHLGGLMAASMFEQLEADFRAMKQRLNDS
jgi:hypothetical protein